MDSVSVISLDNQGGNRDSRLTFLASFIDVYRLTNHS